jgi:hypothetical protein
MRIAWVSHEANLDGAEVVRISAGSSDWASAEPIIISLSTSPE